MSDDKRFEFEEETGFQKGTKVIVDKETGVQYLFANWGSAGGLTLLVDKDGKPLLAQDSENKEVKRGF